MSARIGIVGAALAAVGLSHFARPQAYESITSAAFSDNIRRHTYIDGGIETAIGAGLIAPKTRKLALAGLVGYIIYLGANVARNRR
ncbi:MAG: hypothetical protein NT146_06735 [Mycobacterium sp.]|jgi:uncharacterized membrane protein|nr:hypothetical protein [Mycobacterium sp.]